MTSTFSQRRRAARLKTQLRLQIVGVDSEFTLVEGDISVVGLDADVARDVGELGSVQRLRLATLAGTEQITLLARIARLATVTDFWRGNVVTGVAFQFMFQESTEIGTVVKTIPIESSWAIGEFVRCLVRENDVLEARVDHTWEGTVEAGGASGAATVNGVSLHGTVLETEFAVPVGELIRVDIPGPDPNQRIPLYGRAIDSRPFATHEGKGYRTSVTFDPIDVPMEPRQSHHSIQDAFGALLSSSTEAIASAPVTPDPKRQHLAGDLMRVSLSSVLTLCELERVTGVLRLCSPLEEVRCYLERGRLLDVEREGASEVGAALAPVFDWQAGTFELLIEPIDREDRVGQATTAFLLHLMTAIDEARAGASA